MKTRHTPGPWTFGLVEATDFKQGFTVNDLGKGRLDARLGVGGGPWEVRAEDEANARLMAAAPDLFDACAAALTVVATMQGMPPALREQLERAIARAKGDAPDAV
jgi:hypothetical protein